CGRPRGVDASGGGRCDRDRLLLGLLGERDRYLHDAIVRLGLDCLGVGASRQRYRAAEGPVAALTPHVVLVLLFLALLVLTGDREDVVLDLDLDLLGLDPGDVGAHDEVAVVAHDVDRRRPSVRVTIGELVEHAIEAIAQLAELGKRIPTRQCSSHDLPPYLGSTGDSSTVATHDPATHRGTTPLGLRTNPAQRGSSALRQRTESRSRSGSWACRRSQVAPEPDGGYS